MQEKAGIGQWTILFTRITELAGLSPWQRFAMGRPMLLRLPGRRDVVYALFGLDGELRRVDFCLGDDALLDYTLFREASPEQAGELRFIQRFLSVRVGRQPGMNEEDMELIARMAPVYRGEDWFIRFRSYEPGYAPANLSRREVTLLIDLTEQLCQALRDYDAGLVTLDPALPETLSRRWEEGSGWVSETAVLHPVRRRPEPLRCTDELLPKRSLRLPIVDAKLELDSFYIPQLIEDENYPKPYYPRVLLLADSGSDQIAGYEMLTPGDSLREKLAALIEGFLEGYGRPLILYLNDPTLCALLGGYLDELSLPWREVGFLPAVNRFKLTRGISQLSGSEEEEEP